MVTFKNTYIPTVKFGFFIFVFIFNNNNNKSFYSPQHFSYKTQNFYKNNF